MLLVYLLLSLVLTNSRAEFASLHLCLDEIFNTYFKDALIVFLIPQKRESFLTTEIIVDYSKKLNTHLIGTITTMPYLWTDIQLYMLIYGRYTRDYFTSELKSYPRLNLGRLLIVIYEGNVGLHQNISTEVLGTVWKYTLTSCVIVMFVDRRNVFYFYTWFPFNPIECRNVSSSVLLDIWNNSRFLLNSDIFDDKITNDLNGCTVNVAMKSCPPFSYFDDDTQQFYYGFEYSLWTFLASAMNFEIKWAVSDKYTIDYDKPETGAFELLRTGEVDAVVSCLMLTHKMFKTFDFVMPYFEDSLLWCVPRPNYYPRWTIIYRMLNPFVWFCFISTTFIVVLVACFLARKLREHYTFKYFILAFLNIAGVLTNVSIDPSPKSSSFRFFFAVLGFFTIHFSTMIQSGILMFTMYPAYELIYRDPVEAVEHGLKVLLSRKLTSLYNQSDMGLWNEIYSPGHYEYVDDNYLIFQEVGVNGTSMSLFPHKLIENIIYSFNIVNKFNKSAILCFSEKYVSYPVSFYMTEDHPLLDLISYKILQFAENGWSLHWTREMDTGIDIIFQHALSMHDSTQSKLNIRHLRAIFIFYAVGMVISYMVLLIELLSFYAVKAKKKRISKKKRERLFHLDNRVKKKQEGRTFMIDTAL